MSFQKSRAGHNHAARSYQKRDANCASNTYLTPTAGQTVDALQTVEVSWDPSCLGSTANINLYLYAPTVNSSYIYVWQNIPSSDGSYNASLMPRWWADAPTVQLQFQINDASNPAWMSTFPSGPFFTATYTEPSTGTPSSADLSLTDSGSTNVSQGISGAAVSSQLSKGKIAAAVIMPLLALICGVILYLYFSRKKGFAKRKEWTENVDKRMSTISADWKSMSAAGASAAIRQSMAGSRTSLAFGTVRPVSVAATEGGQAGVGARGLYMHENGSLSQMSQLRPGLRSSAFENRVSRVSFANDPRPSHEGRRSQESRRSRALYTASTYDDVPDVPPLPAYQSTLDAVGTMSPLQTSGAISLSVDDIHAKVGDNAQRTSTFDEVLPALSLMRTGGLENDEGSFYPETPSQPEAAHSKSNLTPDYYQTITAPATTIFSASPMSPNYPTSPVTATNQYGMVMQPLPANVMSPDDMLRAYAERNAAARTSGMAVPSKRLTHHRPSSYSLGSGIGFGALNTDVTYPNPTAGTGRSIIPASPGSYSPSRGAYGVESVYEPEENIGMAE